MSEVSPPTFRPVSSLLTVAGLGGCGGAVNAFWCYAKFPVGISGGMDFAWTIIPAGAAHGALLALCVMAGVILLQRRPRTLQWLGILLAGWLTGWLSFIPIHLYILSVGSTALTRADLLKALWPYEATIGTLWAPYSTFGLVALFSFGGLILWRPLTTPRLSRQLLIGSLSGTAGSLWWWSVYGPWYLCLLHGTIWGSLVGLGVWQSRSHSAALAPASSV